MKNRREKAFDRRQKKAIECFKSAELSIGPIEKGMSIFGITRGQFSMIDIVLYAIDELEDCELSLWTWCIADYEIKCVETLMNSGKLKKATLIIDSSARGKNLDILNTWIEKFGLESVRFVVNHSKIATIKSKDLELLIRGSMNLNNNPRFEQFDIDEGCAGFDLVKEIESELPILSLNHTSKEVRKASKIDQSWTQQQLIPFGKTKVWAK